MRREQEQFDELLVSDSSDSFGVGRAIHLLRESSVGCTRFRVDVAPLTEQRALDDPPELDSKVVLKGVGRSKLEYVGLEEFHPDATTYEPGTAARLHLAKLVGQCSVRTFVFDNICDLVPKVCDVFIERFKIPRRDHCLSCPPFELLEHAILGGAVRTIIPFADRIRAAIEQGETIDIDLDEIEKRGVEGAHKGLAEFSAEVLESTDEVRELVASTLGALD